MPAAGGRRPPQEARRRPVPRVAGAVQESTVLQYLCPIGILAYVCIKDRVAPTVSEICSILLAIGGTFLIATHGQLNQLAITPNGLLVGLFSAFTHGLYILLSIDLIKKWGSILVIGIGMTMAGLFLLPISGLAQHQWDLSPNILLALVGIVVVGYTMLS